MPRAAKYPFNPHPTTTPNGKPYAYSHPNLALPASSPSSPYSSDADERPHIHTRLHIDIPSSTPSTPLKERQKSITTKSKSSNTPKANQFHTPSPSKGSSTGPWTPEEKAQMIHFVVKNGAPGSDKAWEGVVYGRSGSQCRNAWRSVNASILHHSSVLPSSVDDRWFR